MQSKSVFYNQPINRNKKTEEEKKSSFKSKKKSYE